MCDDHFDSPSNLVPSQVSRLRNRIETLSDLSDDRRPTSADARTRTPIIQLATAVELPEAKDTSKPERRLADEERVDIRVIGKLGLHRLLGVRVRQLAQGQGIRVRSLERWPSARSGLGQARPLTHPTHHYREQHGHCQLQPAVAPMLMRGCHELSGNLLRNTKTVN